MRIGNVAVALSLLCIQIIAVGCTAVSGSYHDNCTVSSWSNNLSSDEVFDEKFAENRHPVIFIHGLLGSELCDKNGEVVWGKFYGKSMVDRSLARQLTLPFDKKSADITLQSGKILKKSQVRILGIKYELANYQNMLDLLKKMGYIEEKSPFPADKKSYDLFVYAYDWRKSIAENAAGLARFVAEKKEYLELIRKSNPGWQDKEIRFDLIGHSMGGLIARYYVQYGSAQLGGKKQPLPVLNWAGARNVRKVIQIATPNGGYADTLIELVNGLQLMPGSPIIPPAILGTFSSYYQMLPNAAAGAVRYRRSGKLVDILDVELWKKYRWGILGNDSESRRMLAEMYPALSEEKRNEAALEFLDRVLTETGRFQLAMAKPMGLPPEPVRFYCFAAAGIPTTEYLTVDEENGEIAVAGTAAGDGKVSLRSAHFDYPQTSTPLVWQSVITLDGGHMGIMRSALFARNLAHVLICEP